MAEKVTLHFPAIPWTQVNTNYLTCAYSQKLYKMMKMMDSLDYPIHLYAGQHSDVPERVINHRCIADVEQEMWFGKWDSNDLFTKISWGAEDPYWKKMNKRVVETMEKVIKPGDIICSIAGWSQMPIKEAFPNNLFVEWGVGYEGIATSFCAFESKAWRHYIYGKKGIENIRWFDTVIPNFFDPNEFTFSDQKEDYLLFIGRLVERKGPHIAVQIAEKTGMKIKIAGAGATNFTKNRIECPEVVLEGDHIEYVGPVGVKERAELYAKAKAVIVPTLYVGPFEGVTIEAMMSGTPVLASDLGAMTETVLPIAGARFNTMKEATEGLKHCFDLNHREIQLYAHNNFSLDVVRWEFDRWFKRLSTLYKGGWYDD